MTFGLINLEFCTSSGLRGDQCGSEGHLTQLCIANSVDINVFPGRAGVEAKSQRSPKNQMKAGYPPSKAPLLEE
jgi:hypothetical protein